MLGWPTPPSLPPSSPSYPSGIELNSIQGGFSTVTLNKPALPRMRYCPSMFYLLGQLSRTQFTGCGLFSDLKLDILFSLHGCQPVVALKSRDFSRVLGQTVFFPLCPCTSLVLVELCQVTLVENQAQSFQRGKENWKWQSCSNLVKFSLSLSLSPTEIAYKKFLSYHLVGNKKHPDPFIASAMRFPCSGKYNVHVYPSATYTRTVPGKQICLW